MEPTFQGILKPLPEWNQIESQHVQSPFAVAMLECTGKPIGILMNIFPELHYYTIDGVDELLPFQTTTHDDVENDNGFNNDDYNEQLEKLMVIGASYAMYRKTTPLFQQRRLLFEDRLFPYLHDFRFFTVRYGLCVRPQQSLNLCSYTILNEPHRVLYKSPETHKFVAEFRFRPTHIELFEVKAS